VLLPSLPSARKAVYVLHREKKDYSKREVRKGDIALAEIAGVGWGGGRRKWDGGRV
jgi:hypothetical protein